MHMAMTICSSSNYSPNISLSSYSSDSNLKVSSYVSYLAHSQYPSSNYTCTLVQEDQALMILPSVELCKDATASARKMEKILDTNGSDKDVNKEEYWFNEVKFRKKRRRKTRCKLECKEINDNEKMFDFVDKKALKSTKFMTPKEEATYSWYLKERARIEGVRTELLSEMKGQELSSSQWAKTLGLSQHNLDKILCNGRESEEKITSSYHRLVVSVASSYVGRGLSMQDLTQEGSIGLLRGAMKFNPERGYKLSTYAYWWIRQSISRAVAKKSKIIRLPGTISELVPKICEANAVLSRKFRRYPTYDEIAEAIDVKPSAVRLAFEGNRTPISLDQAITIQGCMFLQDIIPGPNEITPEAMVKKDTLKPEIQKLLKPLCDREAQILRLHYGLNGDAPRSFEDIGRYLNLSRERVRQIYTDALSKLRKTSEMDDLKYFI